MPIAPSPRPSSPATAVGGITTPSSPVIASAAPPRKPYRFATACATVDDPNTKDQYGSSSIPIYQTATFKGMGGVYDYSRSGNPTRSHLQHHLAKISNARHAYVVSSGMAAMDVICRLLKPGDEIIAGDDLYGGTNRLLGYLQSHGGIIVHHVDTTQVNSIEPVLSASKTRMVLLESPTNPLLKIADIQAIAASVHAVAPDAIVVADNTMMSPYLQRPLELGCDIVYDSGTKYLSGHHDLMAGVIVCDRDDINDQIAFTINTIGNALSPQDSFLLLRGVKTLALRMDKQQASARRVAEFLYAAGFKTHYPGLASHPGKDIHDRLADGPGAVLSFETGDKELSERIVGAARLWGISVSFGAVNSLISMPCLMSHASISAATRAARGLPEDLIRLCVGIEDADDLLDDLESALIEAGAVRPVLSKLAGPIIERGDKLERVPAGEDQKIKHVQPQTQMPAVGPNLIVSAPGKVILFGEHAVVHGVTAIAASIDLRCYGFSSPRSDGLVSLVLPDVGGFSHAWSIDSLPWESSTPSHPLDDLDAPLVQALQAVLPKSDDNRADQAAVAFLYLFIKLSQSSGTRVPHTFIVRSALPISAGLGSSASYSGCVAAALLLNTGTVGLPAIPTVPHTHVSHSGRKAIPTSSADQANIYAFLAEKILHGNPSGIDNAVAVYGGALAYTRPSAKSPGGMDALRGFASVRFLLTDSRVPRNTRELVAAVGAKKDNEPEYVGGILDAVQAIADEVKRCLSDPEMERKDLLAALEAFIDENHCHLVSLGVSHPMLEVIRARTAEQPWGLKTKLTGAGGGGCTITLVPDDFPAASLASLVESLRSSGFECYSTSVGGSGLGVLVPQSRVARASPQGGNGKTTLPDLKKFEDVKAEELAEWAEGEGRWAYV
uniref:Cystathionine beta-lyase n=1 Tax=Bartheletia paradoxa TaxID=669517 RepID=A0A2D0XHV1_9BASI|nr:hypothetical protein SPAR06913 [Bartheletia paradoxa]